MYYESVKNKLHLRCWASWNKQWEKCNKNDQG